MNIIDLQNKTKAQKGKVEIYWFKNKIIGLEKTQFHRIIIPLEPFDSGLDYDEQPVLTELVLDWYELNMDNPLELDGMNLSHACYPEAECSIYIGCAHNLCDVKKLLFSKINNNTFNLIGSVVVEFENEGVAMNEVFKFNTDMEILET
ncbi:MAG: hypothetical protein AB8B80_03730 [Marinicellaceae bacterium]